MCGKGSGRLMKRPGAYSVKLAPTSPHQGREYWRQLSPSERKFAMFKAINEVGCRALSPRQFSASSLPLDLLPPGLRRGSFFVGPALQDQRANRMQISWDEVNRTEQPGPYFVARLGLDVFVSEESITRWKADPGCHHRVVDISTARGKLYSLRPREPLQED